MDLGVGDVGNIVLRDRQHLAEDGIIIVVLTLERRTQPVCLQDRILYPEDLYMSVSQKSLMEDARKAVADALDKCLRRKAYGLE